MQPHDRLARSLIDAAVGLHRLRLWLSVPSDTPILVRVPGEEHPLLVTVMGHLGSEYGLFLVRGESALADFRRYMATAGPAVEALDMLAMNMEQLGKIPLELRGILQAAGVSARREALVPLFFVRDARSDEPRLPSRREQRLLLAVMRGFMLTHAAGELVVKTLDKPSSRLLEITVEGEGRELRASTRTSRWGAGPLDAEVPELDASPSLPKTDQRWVLGVIAGRELKAPELEGMQILVLADAASDELIDQCLAPVDSGAQALALLSAAIRGDSSEFRLGFPAEVACSDEVIFAAVAASLEAAGVRCRMMEASPKLAAAVARLRATKPSKLLEGRERFNEDVLPTTLSGWKSADLRITRRLSTLVNKKSGAIGRSLARFFGSETIAAEVLHELEDLQPIPSYVEWKLADYRPTARSKTFLEQRLLNKKLSPTERALIEARVAARVSIFRVAGLRPGEEIDFEDIFDGAKFTVQERAMSGCAIDGWFLPLRIMKVAEWHFLATAGPPLDALTIDGALAYLNEVGAELSPSGLKRHAHLLGGLWESLLSRAQRTPKLCNTDGDPLLWHSATFRLRDPAAVAAILSSKEYVRIDEEGSSWTWWRPGGPSPGFGDNTTLARLEIIDTRLVLEVNSAARFARAREWIEALPGVKFERVTEKQVLDSKPPLDDALPSPRTPMSPDLTEAVKRALGDACRRWLDESVPALGNRTPRQACKSAAGRKQVELMIRTWPASGSPNGPIEPPREELLRELGISSRG
jgi:hypothetical protein